MIYKSNTRAFIRCLNIYLCIGRHHRNHWHNIGESSIVDRGWQVCSFSQLQINPAWIKTPNHPCCVMIHVRRGVQSTRDISHISASLFVKPSKRLAFLCGIVRPAYMWCPISIARCYRRRLAGVSLPSPAAADAIGAFWDVSVACQKPWLTAGRGHGEQTRKTSRQDRAWLNVVSRVTALISQEPSLPPTIVSPYQTNTHVLTYVEQRQREEHQNAVKENVNYLEHALNNRCDYFLISTTYAANDRCVYLVISSTYANNYHRKMYFVNGNNCKISLSRFLQRIGQTIASPAHVVNRLLNCSHAPG